MKPRKTRFTVKVHIQVNVDICPGMVKDACLLVYNKDHSVYGGIQSTEPIYDLLHQIIVDKGVSGRIKGYFPAMYKDGKLMINPHKIQTPYMW